MTKELAELLVEGADAVGVDAKLRDDYSGHGMNGRKEYGVEFGDWTDALRAAFEAGRITENQDEPHDLSAHTLRSDGMGRGLVLY